MRSCIKKRLVLFIYIIIVYAISLSGCSAPHYDGQELVDAAALKHTALESAHITVYDNINGAAVQEITYRFAGDVMQYMYIGHDPETDKTYLEYNNGTELNMKTVPDEAQWTFFTKGDENYYNYSRASRHYFADGKLLLNDYEGAVSGARISDIQDGGKALELSYDTSKLTRYASLSAYGEFTAFAERFLFDANGLCTEYQSSFETADGIRRDYTMKIEARDESLAIERADIS